ncbi:MAG TPA: DUF3106 domain-containing protein [Candidatus Paceibacterota bacterium]|nr:DUF3106 domain-containing protein [Verrucomicrobiota bacterium]HRY48210.1 DUF3106 domain-containing protein [Candidatus Paceibacterota bacterium]HSA00838.1 DUF3106 domain-containing protein [Candidatus Paceibacterota bacterium]
MTHAAETDRVHLSHPQANAVPAATSPVDFFQELLHKTPEQRALALADKSESRRQQILAKLQEYEALDPRQRELRLQATQLKWRLLTLMKLPPGERHIHLAKLAPDEKNQLEDRLHRWDQLPTNFQQAVLAEYYPQGSPGYIPATQRTSATSVPSRPYVSPPHTTPRTPLSVAEKEKILKSFHQFFDLTETEKQRILGLMDQASRQQTETALMTWQRMTAPQRQGLMKSVSIISELPPEQQERYLRMAEQWTRLAPNEQTQLRKYAAQLPPLPAGFTNSATPGFMPSTSQQKPPPLPQPRSTTNPLPPLPGMGR